MPGGGRLVWHNLEGCILSPVLSSFSGSFLYSLLLDCHEVSSFPLPYCFLLGVSWPWVETSETMRQRKLLLNSVDQIFCPNIRKVPHMEVWCGRHPEDLGDQFSLWCSWNHQDTNGTCLPLVHSIHMWHISHESALCGFDLQSSYQFLCYANQYLLSSFRSGFTIRTYQWEMCIFMSSPNTWISEKRLGGIFIFFHLAEQSRMMVHYDICCSS